MTDIAYIVVMILVLGAVIAGVSACTHWAQRRAEQRQLNAIVERREADERRIRRGLWKLDDRHH